MNIRDMSEASRFEQLAEETRELTAAASHELGEATQKLARILRGESPTPVTEKEARKQFIEEAADVFVCLYACIRMDEIPEFNRLCVEKQKRWEDRLRENDDR